MSAQTIRPGRPDQPDRILALPTPDWRPPRVDIDEVHLADPDNREVNPVLDLVYPPRGGIRQPVPASAGRFSDGDPAWCRPDPTTWAGRMGLALVEVAAGCRPATQVMRWTSGAVYGSVLRRRASYLRRGPGTRPPLSLRGVTVCHPCDGVVEASVLVGDGRRVRAVALRLRGQGRRWVVDALELG
ncbi:MAG TPA: Rv3235 family protein [Dermatophilaceae bacterium]|nr:Rv3235 family protein [Dermatophilaceae bacterium]